MAKEHQPAISEDDTSRILTYSQLSTTHAPPPPPISAGAPTAYSGAPLVHLPPPTTRTTSNFGDSARIIALESMVNQLATNMATNMTELMALLRDQNRASSSYIPPPGQRSMVDPNLVVPLTFVSESEEAPMSVVTYVMAIYPNNDPLPPPPAPTAVPLPPATFLSADSAILTSTLLAMPAAPATPPANFLPETENEQERRVKKMEETIKVLQAGRSRFDFGDSDWNLLPGMRLPLKIKIPDFKRGAYYSHLLSHTASFSELIQAGKKLDIDIKLGRIEGPTRTNEGETSKTIAGASSTGELLAIFCELYTYATPRGSTSLLKPIQIEPRLQDLLSRRNGPQPRKPNKAAKGRPGLVLLLERNLLSFNEVNCPNVQNNHLLDHGSSSGPIVNIIVAYPFGEDEIEKE
ncbi:hypothetical protein CRG98_017849 [Punica granatum]|uniref:Uncharacterized protein n=1 Tax=Punica granatum TaxID=22663 RepID=A0A2I0JZI0_PUNGR|nr:hypothetical protein CRG98_017849 [Punica granatum]